MGIYIKDPDSGSIKKITGGDIQPGTYLTHADINNNLTTTESGKALDARQGRVLDEKITITSQDLTTQFAGLETSFDVLKTKVADLESSVDDPAGLSADDIQTVDGTSVQDKLDFINGEISNVSQNLSTQMSTLGVSVDTLSTAVADLEETVNNPRDITADSVRAGEDGISVQEKLDSLEENKVDFANIANGLTVGEEGFVLDARQGKVLNDKINAIDTSGGRLFDVLWTGNTAMGAQNIVTYPSGKYNVIAVNCSSVASGSAHSGMVFIPVGTSGVKVTISQSEIFWQRGFTATTTTLSCTAPTTYRGQYSTVNGGANAANGSIVTNDNNICVPRTVWGIKF